MDVANKISNQQYIDFRNSSALLNMLEGIRPMINSAPDSDKKEMLLDVVEFATRVAEQSKLAQNTIQYLLTDNSRLEALASLENLKVLRLETNIIVLERWLESALPIDEFKSKIEKLK